MLPCLFLAQKRKEKKKDFTVVYLHGREAFMQASIKTLQLSTQTTEIRNQKYRKYT